MPAHAPAPPPSRALLWLVAVGMFMQLLDASIVHTALPAMAHDMGESPLRMQAAAVAYSLTMAVVIPATGWLADRFGTQRLFMLAIALFSAGSLACAAAPNLPLLAAARVLQGLGGAMLMPVGRLVLLRTFGREQFLHAMSFVAIPGLLGPLMGPPLGGWLVQAASWHWVFLINLPVGLAGALATWRLMPNLRTSPAPRFDWAGYALLALGMVGVCLALEGAGGMGMPAPQVALLMLLGLAALAAYARHALRSPAPLFAPALLALPGYRIGLAGNLFARIGSGAMPYLMPLFMQVGMGFAPLHAGLMMLPMTLGGMAAKRMVERLIVRQGYRRVLVGNTLLMGALIAAFALMSPAQPLWLGVAQMAAFGAVNSIQFTAMNTVTLRELDARNAASGNSLFSMVQMLGMSLGVSCAAALLQAFAHDGAASAVNPEPNGAASAVNPEPNGAASAAPVLDAFAATLLAIGALTAASAAIFRKLPATAVQAPQKR